MILVSEIFNTYSMDFAGPVPNTRNGKRFILIAVEHLTGWHLAWATETPTAPEVIEFVEQEVMHSFGPLQIGF